MFNFFKKGLEKTAEVIKKILPETSVYIERDKLEEILIESDVDYDLIEYIMNQLPNEINRKALKSVLVDLFPTFAAKQISNFEVTLIIGVNGAGKTTTIAKLANIYKNQGYSVILGAGDTFRAAAIEQLKRWSDKIGVPIVYTKQGHDPSAVTFDTIKSAEAKHIQKVIIDTAGRLQTQTNLANELKKIVRICDKAHNGAPHKKILILDGTQGNSAIKQADAFNEMVGVDGIIITKLDGTAKGGAVFSIVKKLELPLLYVGVGEKQDDLIPFEPEKFVDTFLDSMFKPKDN